MKSSQIGVQLYTVREATAQDMVGTLSRLAGIGYGAVEFAGFGNASPRQIRTVLEAEGITAIAAHVQLVDLETRPMQALAECELLGCEWVVVPSVGESWLASVEDVERLAERLNSLGRLCHAEGLKLAFHNHAQEFQALEGTTPWEILRHETSPDLVDLELDLYWAAYAGVRPDLALRESPGRIKLVHAKDMADAGPQAPDAPVGEGTLPWPEILEAAETAGVSWYIVEQDEPADAFADLERSLHNLRRLAGLPDD
jgi:sugar phosphate isomerase/epimerase